MSVIAQAIADRQSEIDRLQAEITKMKDGRTHLAHKAEHAVDLETGVVVGLTVQDANAGDTTTMVETLVTATEQVEAVLPAGGGIAEVVGDKGYHSNETLIGLADLGLRSYVSEPDRGRRCWQGKPAARDGAFGVPGGSACCASAANGWSGPTPTSTKPGACAGCICAGTPTSSSAFWCTRAASIWASSCDSRRASGRRGASRAASARSSRLNWLLVWH